MYSDNINSILNINCSLPITLGKMNAAIKSWKSHCLSHTIIHLTMVSRDFLKLNRNITLEISDAQLKL